VSCTPTPSTPYTSSLLTSAVLPILIPRPKKRAHRADRRSAISLQSLRTRLSLPPALPPPRREAAGQANPADITVTIDSAGVHLTVCGNASSYPLRSRQARRSRHIAACWVTK